MLEEIVPIFKNFRDRIYQFFPSRRDAAESWWQLAIIAYAQLYLSRSLANILPNPWERYLPAFKSNATIKSPTQVQNDFGRIIRMIGRPAQPPKPRQKAPGRELGDIQIKRTRHPIVKKSKNTTLTERMIA